MFSLRGFAEWINTHGVPHYRDQHATTRHWGFFWYIIYKYFWARNRWKWKDSSGEIAFFKNFANLVFVSKIYFGKFLLRLENCNFKAFRVVIRQNWRKLTPAEIHFYPRKQVWCIPKAQLRPSIGCGTEKNSRTSGSYYYTVDKTWNILIVNYY